MSHRDTLFEERIMDAGDFVFDERVVRVFPDMINRSVPGYGLIIPLLGMLARRYAQPGSSVFDLGCSLGAATQAMRQAIHREDVKIVAVDNSPQMVARFRKELAEHPGGTPVEIVAADIRDVEIVNASVVVLNFTLQFVDPVDRPSLLASIARGLRPGGVLILSEKLLFESPKEQQLQTDWHHDFKRAQGYSDLEISAKRDALEDVLKPETEAVHRDRLRVAGFKPVVRWFQGFSFASFIAIKPDNA